MRNNNIIINEYFIFLSNSHNSYNIPLTYNMRNIRIYESHDIIKILLITTRGFLYTVIAPTKYRRESNPILYTHTI